MRRALRIGLIGYYGFGNVGDEAILENLRCFLSPHQVITLPVGLLNSPATIRRLNDFDFLILGGGGLYRSAPPSPFGQFDVWGPQLQTPIGILGLGITALPPQFVAATHRLVEQSAFFLVRDEQSRRLLNHPKVRVAPDLTFYRPPEIERRQENGASPICGVNLRPAHAGIEHWVQAINELPYARRAMPFSFHPALGDRETLLAIDPGCPDKFTMTDYGRIDFLIGTAFHSTVFAIQLGIPVVAINYDQKVARLMDEVGLSEYTLQWDEAKKLQDCCERVLADREAICRRMQSYTSEATERVHRELQEPREIIEQASPTGSKAAIEKSKVSVVVNWQGGDVDALERTLASCLEQTHESLELIVVSDEEQGDAARDLVKGRVPVKMVDLAEGASWRLAGLEAATGDHIACIEAGGSYAVDALALMSSALQDNADVDLVNACYFLTGDGIIERKVRLDSARARGTPRLLGPCWLVRRSAARRFLTEMQQRHGQLQDLLNAYRLLYLEAALFFKPASERESNLYRSLLAYARGDVAQGKQLLARALATVDDDVGIEDTAEELAEMLVSVARNANATAEAEDFVNMVFQNLPSSAGQIRKLERRAQANVALNQFFERYQAHNWHGALRTAWRGIRYDPRWLRDRGSWVMLVRATVAAIGGLP